VSVHCQTLHGYLAFHSYVISQNQLGIHFPILCAKQIDSSCLVNCFHVTGSMQDGNCSGHPLVLRDGSAGQYLSDLVHRSH
jgi:hypothetical protein